MTATQVFLVLFSLLSLVLNTAGQLCIADANGATAAFGAASTSGAGSITSAYGIHIERTSASGGQGKLWIVENTGNSIVRYPSAFSFSSVATPELTLPAASGGAISLSAPTYVTTDSLGVLYVSDTSNARILMFSGCYLLTATSTASGVLGQTSLAAGNNVAPGTASSVNVPTGLGFDNSVAGAPSALNPLFSADQQFNEILLWSAITGVSMQAAPTSTGMGAHGAGTNALTALSAPNGLSYVNALDVLYIADTSNSRVMAVTGAKSQTITSAGTNLGTTPLCSGTQLNLPSGVSYDVSNNILYIADTSNFRIVYVTASATGVLGTALNVLIPSGNAVTTCASGTTGNAIGLLGSFDVDNSPISSAPAGTTGPTIVYSDNTNARVLKLCSGTISTSLSTSAPVGVSPSTSLSLSGVVGAGSASISLSAGAGTGVSSSISLSTGATVAATVAVSISPSVSLTVSITSSFSLSLTVSLTTSITTSLTTSITNSFTNSNSYSLSITNSVTNSYSPSVTNSYTNSYSNTNSYSHTISVTRSVRLCGNGKIDGREKCDDGSLNGYRHGCCRRNCRFKYGGHICNAPLSAQCYGKGRCDKAGNCADLKIKTGKRCNVAGNTTGVKDGRCNINAVCIAHA